MFKKLLLASAVLTASTSIAVAGHSYKGERDYKGEMPAPACPSYTYAAGPYIGLSAGVRNNYSGAPLVYQGLEGTLSVGYAAMVSPSFYLAGELLAGDSINLKDYTVLGNGVRTTWSYGLGIIPGYMITDYVLGYARVGVVRSRFTDQGDNGTGWQVGLGAQTNLVQNWDLRGEYVYTGYNTISGIGKPQANQFNLGVVYKFV